MSSEYLNNKKLEIIIIEFQKLKKYKKMYSYLILNSHKNNLCKDKIYEINKEISNRYDIVQNNLAKAFYTLSENIVRYAKFSLIDPDDSIQEGVLICFEKLDRFDPKVGKAFNYMTTCILNHFKQLYRSARNYGELKKRYQEIIMKNINNEINFAKSNTQN